jgi:RND family efflux transporter MFP subunit
MLLAVALQNCGESGKEAEEQPVRGLRVYKVAVTSETDVSVLSFEIPGQLKAINLEVGQRVRLGDVLTEIEPRSLLAQVEQATAAVQQAEAQLANAEADFGRQEELVKRQVVSQAAFDRAQAALLGARAQRDQTARQRDLANHNLERSKLAAPFSGTIARVDVKSFAQITAGQPVLSLFSDDGFDISFLAPSGIFQSLKVGQPVDVTVADLPELRLKGRVKELGSQALQVSAFPVVVRLDNEVAGLNAGMAVEVAVEAPLIGGSSGFLLPLSALIPEGGKDLQGAGTVFLYDGATSTVRRHTISVGGVRENLLVVTQGLRAGDFVASAGVSYLVDGQKVKLLPLQE